MARSRRVVTKLVAPLATTACWDPVARSAPLQPERATGSRRAPLAQLASWDPPARFAPLAPERATGSQDATRASSAAYGLLLRPLLACRLWCGGRRRAQLMNGVTLARCAGPGSSSGSLEWVERRRTLPASRELSGALRAAERRLPVARDERSTGCAHSQQFSLLTVQHDHQLTENCFCCSATGTR